MCVCACVCVCELIKKRQRERERELYVCSSCVFDRIADTAVTPPPVSSSPHLLHHGNENLVPLAKLCHQ